MCEKFCQFGARVVCWSPIRFNLIFILINSAVLDRRYIHVCVNVATIIYTLHALAPGDIHHSLKINTEKCQKKTTSHLYRCQSDDLYRPIILPRMPVAVVCCYCDLSIYFFFYYKFILAPRIHFRKSHDFQSI